MVRQSIELQHVVVQEPVTASLVESSPTVEENVEAHGSGHEFTLPPVDGGKQAYLFLAASFAIEALVWGKSRELFFSFSACFSSLWSFT
jgi:hypothetical protein